MQQIHKTVLQLIKYSLFSNGVDSNDTILDENKYDNTEQKNISNDNEFENLNQNITFDINEFEHADWDAIFQELKNHTVLGLPAEFVIKNLNVPDEVKKRFTSIAYGQVGKWTKLMTEQQKLIKFLNDNDIEVVIIKGSVAALNYPKPEYRAMGDVDFFVRPQDLEKTYQLMLDNGYCFSKGEYYGKLQITKDFMHHVGFKKDGFVFELHRNMSESLQDEEMNQKMQDFIVDGFEHIESVTMDRYQFQMFPKKVNGLIFIKHIVQHIGESSGIGLRQVIDWMMYVNRYVDDDYWNNEFENAVSRIGLCDCAKVFTRMCQLYLGLSDENRTWCMDVDDTLCTRWMEQIVQMGNFGQVSKKKNEGANLLFKNKNIFTVIKSLHFNGTRNWKYAKKYRLVRPFASIYQITRYLRKGLGRKKPIQSLKEDFEKSRNKKSIIEQLNIQGCTMNVKEK